MSIPNTALTNSMACHIFRAVKLGFISDFQSSNLGISLQFSNYVWTTLSGYYKDDGYT